MIVAVTRETFPGENRVALTAAMVPTLVAAGLEVWVESSAGAAAGFPDESYIDAGAKIVADRRELFAADVILQVRSAGANPNAGRADFDRFRRGQVVIGMCDPLGTPRPALEMADRGATLFAMEMVPRITRAQSMDVLSSMATVAGYRAVLLAAEALPKMFPMMMTAAGTIRPAKVFVMGVGVALLIFYFAWTISKDAISPLLGEAPPPEKIAEIQRIAAAAPKVLRVHDIIYHNYGGTVDISLHIEVSDKESATALHDVAEAVEEEVGRRLGGRAIVHVDPIRADHPRYQEVARATRASRLPTRSERLAPCLAPTAFWIGARSSEDDS